jgi:opacity protein-like surface antigen
MKNIITFFALCFTTLVSAQQLSADSHFSSGLDGSTFERGRSTLSIGYGVVSLDLGKALTKGFIGIGSTTQATTSLGPLYAKYEYAVNTNWGLGIDAMYSDYKITYKDYNDDTYFLKSNTLSLLVRANYHFDSASKFDPYIGFGLGYRTRTYEENDPGLTIGDSEFPLGLNLTLGTRYYFTPNFGVYTEIGLAKSLLQGGLSLSF